MMKSDRLILGLLIGFVSLLGWSEGAMTYGRSMTIGDATTAISIDETRRII